MIFVYDCLWKFFCREEKDGIFVRTQNKSRQFLWPMKNEEVTESKVWRKMEMFQDFDTFFFYRQL